MKTEDFSVMYKDIKIGRCSDLTINYKSDNYKVYGLPTVDIKFEIDPYYLMEIIQQEWIKNEPPEREDMVTGGQNYEY